MHVTGEQLGHLTGIAAVLRFPLPEIEDDDDSDEVGVVCHVSLSARPSHRPLLHFRTTVVMFYPRIPCAVMRSKARVFAAPGVDMNRKFLEFHDCTAILHLRRTDCRSWR